MPGASESVALQHGQNAVQVTSSTWARDSHDLFDFESQQLERREFTVPTSTICVRSGSEVEMEVAGGDATTGGDPLVRVVERGGTFWLDKPSQTSPKKLWMVVRHVSPNGHKLRENDTIKLGRFKFRVRQLVTEEQGDVQPHLGLQDSSTCCVMEADPELTATKTCRICLMEGPGEDDPLITPCSCKGTIEHVHLKCLRHWTSSRLNLPESPLGSYFYRPLSCELCKGPYPAYVSKGGSQRTPLMEVPRTQPPYVVLEGLTRDKQNRGLYVVSLAEKPLTLGRGHSSDVRIQDVSISRCHATIRFQEGDFLLEDNDSKFGTLLAMKHPRQIEASAPIAVQVGRTVLSLALTSRDE